MSTETTNYGLIKPDSNEYYDVAVTNANMNIIDGVLKQNADAIAAAQTATEDTAESLDTHLSDLLTGANGSYAINMMADSGRFGGDTVDPLAVNLLTGFVASDWLQNYNNASAFVSAGKFIYNNTTYGGTGGELTQDVKDLLAAMLAKTGTAPSRYSTEFYIAQTTAGNGTGVPLTKTATKYLLTTNGQKNVGPRFTWVFWIRVKSGSSIYIQRTTTAKLYKDLVEVTDTYTEIAAADGWVHITMLTVTPNAYDNALPQIFANEGAIVQIALPAVLYGGLGVSMHLAPIPAISMNTSNNVPHLGVAANTGNSYNISHSNVIRANTKFSITFGSAATGAATLLISSIGVSRPLVKPGGANHLPKAGTYTYFYNGVTFQLLGEGGDIPKLPNLVRNGSFEFDFNNWTIEAGTMAASSGTGTFGAQTAYQGLADGDIIQDIAYIVGHKYYMCAWGWFASAGGYFYIGFISNNAVRTSISAPSTNLNTWQFGSMVFTCNGTLKVGVGTWGDGRTQNSHYDGVMVFDLTQAYGAGNEPAQADLDAMVQANGGWWDNDGKLLVGDTTATVNDVLYGKIFRGSDMYKAYGNIPVVTADISDQYPAMAISNTPGGNLFFQIPANTYIKNTNWIRWTDPNFNPTNIANGIHMLGLVGTNTNKPWASSSGLAGGSLPFLPANATNDNQTVQLPYLEVSGLTFTPTVILIKSASGGSHTYAFYFAGAPVWNSYNRPEVIVGDDYGFGSYISYSISAYVNATGFRLPMKQSGSVTWFAA